MAVPAVEIDPPALASHVERHRNRHRERHAVTRRPIRFFHTISLVFRSTRKYVSPVVYTAGQTAKVRIRRDAERYAIAVAEYTRFCSGTASFGGSSDYPGRVGSDFETNGGISVGDGDGGLDRRKYRPIQTSRVAGNTNVPCSDGGVKIPSRQRGGT